MLKKKNAIRLAGILLIISSFIVLIASQILNKQREEMVAEIVKQIENFIPKRISCMADLESEMPIYQIRDEDFIGLVEVLSYQLKLPVAHESSKKSMSAHPCRLWGNVYDNTLILEGKNKEGQFECLTQIDMGEEIVFVDMSGAEFSYVVERIERSKQVNAEYLLDSSYELTLLTKDTIDNQYIVVRCVSKWKSKMCKN